MTREWLVAGTARRVLIATFTMLTFSLAGCVFGPTYKRPEVDLPAQHRGAPVTAADAPSLGEVHWFDLFRDDALNGLIRIALTQNFDVRIAAERVLQSRAQLGIQRSALAPELDAAASYDKLRGSHIGGFAPVPPGVDPEKSFTEVGFSLSWELDVWGRLRRLSEAARARYLASREVQHGVVTTLVSDVAATYFDLSELDAELAISDQTREIAERGLSLTRLRRDRGVATGLDVKQAEQLLYQSTAQIAATRRAIEQTENALSGLLGRNPETVARGTSLDAYREPADVPPGLPSAILEHRPDVRAAELTLVAANAEIGAARAQYFPQISLTGFLGGESRELSDLFTAPGRTWSFVPASVLPIFNAGRIRSVVRLTEAQQREIELAYRKTIQTAFREVADALAAYTRTREQRTQQESLVGALRESGRLSRLRYEGGMDSYLQVLDSERSTFQGELALARLKRDQLVSIVDLYRALGGGWE